MTPILRTERLQPSELQALFGEEKDYSCSLNDIVHHTEECEQRSDRENIEVCDLSSLSDPADYGKPCSAHQLQRPLFSNQEYYTKLEEIKREHLRNMAGLEKLYLSQIKPGQRERHHISCWRQNGEDTESSEQVELIQLGSKVSAARLKNGASLKIKQERQNSFEEHGKLCHSQNSSHSPANQVMDSLRQNSKVTIPRPFRMMLREEDRKRRNVKTRSEMELENERLKKELDELKECGKKFRARPAPASTHLLFYDIIKKQPNKLQQQKNRIIQADHNHQGNHHQQSTQHHASPLPQQPFSFIERERKKREKKLADELNNLSPKAERTSFKARPVPRSLYRPSSPISQMYGAVNLNHRRLALPPNILEDTLQEGEEAENEYDDEFSRPESTDISHSTSGNGSNLRKWKSKGLLQVEEEMERKRNRERDRDWSYIHPLHRTSICHNQEPPNTCKSDYISV